jgi:hypothetical protein
MKIVVTGEMTPPMIQTIITILLVTAAAVYLGHRFWKTFKSAEAGEINCPDHCTTCDECPMASAGCDMRKDVGKGPR